MTKVQRLAHKLTRPKWMFWVSRRRAIGELAALGPSALPAVPELIRLFDGDPKVASAAVDAFEHIGAPAVPFLMKALMGMEGEVSVNAAWALSHIGPPAKDAVPCLIYALKCSLAMKEREITERELELLRTGFRNLDVPLPRGVHPSSTSIGLAAAVALGKIGPAAAAAAADLAVMVDKDDIVVRSAAIEALGGIGPACAAIAAPVLVKVKYGDSILASEAEEAIAAMHAERYEVPHLEGILLSQPGSLLRDHIGDEMRLRARAAERLAQGGTESVPALIKGLEDEETFVRNACVDALGEIGSDALPAVPHLLRGPSTSTYRKATAISEMGAAAIPVLEQTLLDSEAGSTPRSTAKQALKLMSYKRELKDAAEAALATVSAAQEAKESSQGRP